MSMLEVLGKIVQTMSTIEDNINALSTNVATVVRKCNEMCEDAKDLTEAQLVIHAAFDVLIENIRDYIEAERKLINKNKEECRPLLAEMAKEIFE